MSSIAPKFKTLNLTGNAAASTWDQTFAQHASRSKVPIRSGAYLHPNVRGGRKMINIRGTFIGTTHDAARTQFDAIKKECYGYGQDQLWLYDDRYVNATLLDGSFTRKTGAAGLYWEYTLNFLCADPFFYATSGSQLTGTATWNQGAIITQNTSGSTPTNFGDVAGRTRTCQTFTQLHANHHKCISDIRIYPASNVGSPGDNVLCELFAWDADAGETTGSAIDTVTVLAATWDGAVGGSLDLAFDYSYFEPATDYALVIRRPGDATDGSNYRRVNCDTSNPYSNGSMWQYNSGTSTWVEQANNDLKFSMYEPRLTISCNNLGSVPTPLYIEMDFAVSADGNSMRYEINGVDGWCEAVRTASAQDRVFNGTVPEFAVAGVNADENLTLGSQFILLPPGTYNVYVFCKASVASGVAVSWTNRYA
jgi:hypothetical protein